MLGKDEGEKGGRVLGMEEEVGWIMVSMILGEETAFKQRIKTI